MHWPTWQTLFTQLPLAQSVERRQVLPRAQPEHVPPQSTSVSGPFRMWSVQLGPAQALLSQMVLAQSLPCRQNWPGSHFLHVSPPQSTSVTSSFLTASLQWSGKTTVMSGGSARSEFAGVALSP